MRYKELFEHRLTSSPESHILLLDRFFDENPGNTFVFNQARREIKRSISQNMRDVVIPDEVTRKYGIKKTKKAQRMTRLAFIDHSFHCKTASSMFFVSILEEKYDVDVFWSSCWKGVPNSYLKKLKDIYDIAIYWQVFPSTNFFQPRNTIIVPMWDAVFNEGDDFFKKYIQYPFISFSKALHVKCRSCGLFSKYIKYQPRVKRLNNNDIWKKEKPVLYFWQRNYDITWPMLRGAISQHEVDSIYICPETDPGYTFLPPSEDDIKAYNIIFVDWIPSKTAFEESLMDIDIYIAPRKTEGIGLSFLDAMASGCTIICNNQSTMNEYIDNETGYLVDYDNLPKIDLSDWKTKTKNLMNAYKKQSCKERSFSEDFLNCIMEMTNA